MYIYIYIYSKMFDFGKNSGYKNVNSSGTMSIVK
jgi:hypothetical protein